MWDPRSSLRDCVVTFSSPEGTLPSWLKWTSNHLSGIPTEPEGDVRIITRAVLKEKDGELKEYKSEFLLNVERYVPRRGRGAALV